MATLTGAARVALGPELAALFCNDEALARGLLACAPRPRPTRCGGCRYGGLTAKMIDSEIADLNDMSESPHAGAITAALYLQEFVEPGIPWAHLDVMAWNPQNRQGRPEGAGSDRPARPLRLYRRPVRLAGVTGTGEAGE